MPLENRKINFIGSFNYSFFDNLKKHRPSGNLKFDNLGIFHSLKFRISMEKILPISIQLNFTLNTLGFYGLIFISSLGLSSFFSKDSLNRAVVISPSKSTILVVCL